jgi:hypothetical protein
VENGRIGPSVGVEDLGVREGIGVVVHHPGRHTDSGLREVSDIHDEEVMLFSLQLEGRSLQVLHRPQKQHGGGG